MSDSALSIAILVVGFTAVVGLAALVLYVRDRVADRMRDPSSVLELAFQR